MKSKTIFFAIILFAKAFESSAQEFITSSAGVFRETSETTPYGENAIAMIKLNPQTNQFSIDVSILLTNKKDTINENNKQLNLVFTGLFPIADLDFYDLEGDVGKRFTMIGELTINSTKTYAKVNFGLHRSILIVQNLYSPNLLRYPYNISFSLEVNPIDFCLENTLLNCPRIIFVTVKNGIINRFSIGGYDKPR